ncbi:MAG TPA: hypothetical protein VHE33_15420 [Acidobacteriaceae bacterium]|nr:hypothetical protein [Acidobacteriaceae bacterium]
MTNPEPVDDREPAPAEMRGGDRPEDYVQLLPPTERELMEAEVEAFMTRKEDGE